MFTAHYIIPLAIYYFHRNANMLWGLLLGNLIDLDHIAYRIIGEVPWLGSACTKVGQQCSMGYYPLHTITFLIISIILSSLVLHKDQKYRFIGWIGIGITIHFILDYIHLFTGFAF